MVIKYAIWLIPCKKHKRKIQNIISLLSQKYASQSFLPHLTVFSGETNDINEVKDKLEKLNTLPLSLQMAGIFGTKDNIFKSLFIRVSNSSDLRNLAAILGERISNKNINIDDPHISILYKILSEESIEDFSKKYNKIITKIDFCDLYLTSPKTGEWKDIKEWEICHKVKLG